MKHEHLPEGWRFAKLHEFLTRRNSWITIQDDKMYQRCTVSWYNTGVIPRDTIIGSKIRTKRQQLTQEGDFIVAEIDAKEGSFGIVKSDTANSIVSGHYFLFSVNEFLDGNFFEHCIAHGLLQNQVSAVGSTNYSAIRPDDLLHYKIPYPPIDEQRRIAEVLRDADANIARVEAQIEATQSVKRGVMQQLFTYGLGGVNVETTALRYSKVPATWIMNTYADLCSSITVGIVQQPKQYYQSDGVPALRSANVLEGSIILGDMVYISEEANMLHQKSILREGDIVTVRTGYPGTSCVVPTEYDGANCIDLIVSRIKNDINPFFLANWINSDHGKYQVLVGQGGGAQQHFNVSELRKMKVAYPPDTDEQREIVAILSAHDATIHELQAEAASLREVKRGLMQGLLSGNVRL